MEKEEIGEKISTLRDKQKMVSETWAKTGNRETLRFIVDIAPRYFSCERSSIFVHDPSTESVWLECGTGMKERQINVPESSSLVGQVIKSGKTQMRVNMIVQKGAHEMTDMMSGFSTVNVLAAPIFSSKERVIGAIEILNKQKNNQFLEYNDDDREELTKFARFISVSLEPLYQRQELIKISHEIQIRIAKLENLL
ncbi:MAG: GAF domain-containing protein [Gammaproteobacteria bacterium]|nr:GAF domain-containing protein [Gammaproteobacteria bacterium]